MESCRASSSTSMSGSLEAKWRISSSLGSALAMQGKGTILASGWTVLWWIGWIFLFIVLMLLCSTAGKLHKFYLHRRRILIMKKRAAWIWDNLMNPQQRSHTTGHWWLWDLLSDTQDWLLSPAGGHFTSSRWEWSACWRGARQWKRGQG